MNILICCDFDNGGQMAALWKAMNKYTEHKARLINFRCTYLDYEEDIYNPIPDKVNELANWADFFILGETLVPNIQSEPIYQKIKHNNCIVRAGGSVARTYPNLYCTGKLANIMKTGAYHDSTITSRIFPMAHTVNMYQFNEFPQANQNLDRPYRLVFSGTALKHTMGFSGAIMEAWRLLKKKYDASVIEFINIKHTSWAKTLKIKATCDICYDQTSLGFYGSSSIEGMYYNMPTFCYVNGWCKSIHPDLPLISLRDGRAIFDKTVEMIESPEEFWKSSKDGREYCERVHGAKHAIVRWTSLIDYVQNEYRM